MKGVLCQGGCFSAAAHSCKLSPWAIVCTDPRPAIRLLWRDLDTVPLAGIIKGFSKVFKAFMLDQVFQSCLLDVHTKHGAALDAGAARAKRLRYGSVRRVLAYETLPATESCLRGDSLLGPNDCLDTGDFLAR